MSFAHMESVLDSISKSYTHEMSKHGAVRCEKKFVFCCGAMCSKEVHAPFVLHVVVSYVHHLKKSNIWIQTSGYKVKADWSTQIEL